MRFHRIAGIADLTERLTCGHVRSSGRKDVALLQVGAQCLGYSSTFSVGAFAIMLCMSVNPLQNIVVS